MKITDLPALKLLFGISAGIFFAFVGGFLWIFVIAILFGIFLVLSQKIISEVSPKSDFQSNENDEISKIIAVLPLKFGTSNTSFSKYISLLFWAFALFTGYLIGISAKNNYSGAIELPISSLDCVFDGEITKIIRHDSNSIACIAHGTLDSKPFPAFVNSTIFLRIDSTGFADSYFKTGSKISLDGKVRPIRRSFLPTDFNESLYFSSLGAEWIVATKAKKVAILGFNETITTIAENCSENIKTRIKNLFSTETVGIAIALLTGDKSLITIEIREDFSLTGTAHVIAVSGLHVGIIAGIILIPLGFVRSRWLKFSIFVAALLCFAFITGLGASTLRAVVMAILALLAYNFQRSVNLLNVLCLAVVILLSIQPTLLFSASFHLSVVSIAGIAIFLPVCHRFFLRIFSNESTLQRFIAQSLSITFAASVVISPLVAYYFGVVSLISPLANLVVVPLMSLGMCYTLAAVFCSFFWNWGAIAFATSSEILFHSVLSFNKIVNIGSIQNHSALYFAIFFSLAIAYILFSKQRETVIFRTITMCLCGILMLIFLSNSKEGIEIIPREQLTAVVIPIEKNLKVIILQDRSSDYLPKYDFGLEKYLSRDGDSLVIFSAGVASLACAEHLKNIRAVIANTLVLKNKTIFSSIDSLRKRQIPLISAEKYYYSTRLLNISTHDVKISYDVWQNVMKMEQGGVKNEFCLPKLVKARTFK